MLVQAKMDACGNIHARPVAEKWAKRFCKRVADNGGASLEVAARDCYTAFFQEGNGACQFLEDCTSGQRRDLEAGWPIKFRADGWAVGHWYGYDAHTVFEGK